jgi:hypothetical protein
MFGTNYYEQSQRMTEITTGQYVFFRTTDTVTWIRGASKTCTLVGSITTFALSTLGLNDTFVTTLSIASFVTWTITGGLSKCLEPQAKRILKT